MEASLRNAAANGAESLEYFLPPAPASNEADPFADGVSGVSGVSGGLVPVSLDGLAAAAARHRGLTGSKRLLRLPFEPERGDATRYSGFDLCAVNMRPGSLLGAAQTIARLVRSVATWPSPVLRPAPLSPTSPCIAGAFDFVANFCRLLLSSQPGRRAWIERRLARPGGGDFRGLPPLFFRSRGIRGARRMAPHNGDPLIGRVGER